MTFQPIAERELRVASRKRSTFWVRVGTALVALLIGSGFLLLSLTGGVGLGPVSLGRTLFATLSWISLAGVLSAGLFFTSDCLSEEKREGTLGLLFLTDLHAYDVVLGKLLATSLRSFYGLLAVFPILAVPLLMGGVTGLQLWKTTLALVNALTISLATGLIVSAFCRDSQKALAGTLLLLLLWVAGGPMADALFAFFRSAPFNPHLSVTSPGYLFVTAGMWGKTTFWTGLLVNQVMVWTVLGVTCLVLPRAWQDKITKTTTTTGQWAQRWRFGGSERRAALRRKLIDSNPVVWLACRERWQAVALWVVSILLAGGFIIALATIGSSPIWMVGSQIVGLLTIVLYLGVASQVGRFFVEAKRSGLIEMLLATPLSVRQMIQGLWKALMRLYGLPLAVFLAVLMFSSFLAHRQTWAFMSATTTATVATTNTPAATNTSSSPGPANATPEPELGDLLVPMAMGLMNILTIVGNLIALTWFGMWMGMTSKNSSLAALKAILYVQIIPWFAISFLSALVVPVMMISSRSSQGASKQWMMWYPLVMTGSATVLYLIKNVVLSLWARKRLYTVFREQASEGRISSRR